MYSLLRSVLHAFALLQNDSLTATLIVFASSYYNFLLYVLGHSEGYMSILGSGFPQWHSQTRAHSGWVRASASGKQLNIILS